MKLKNFRAFANQYDIRQVDKEAMLHHPGHAVQLVGQPNGIRNLSEAAVQNVMALVGGERLTGLVFSQDNGSAEGTDASGQQGLREGHHFDRQGKLSEHGNQLAGIGDDDHLTGSRGYDLFSQERPAATLDEIERRIDFIGAINGHIDLGTLLKGRQRNA